MDITRGKFHVFPFLKFAVLLLLAISLSGCASTVARSICAANDNPQNFSPRRYEIEVIARTDTGLSSVSRNLECIPSGYYCGGGEWHAQFPRPDPDSAMKFEVAQGVLHVPLPSCGLSQRVGPEWTPIEDWPFATLRVGEDAYNAPAHELRQESALQIFGLRVESYKQRRVE